MPKQVKFTPTNLSTCYEGERVYYKDLPTGRMFTNKECTLEITEAENDVASKQEQVNIKAREDAARAAAAAAVVQK